MEDEPNLTSSNDDDFDGLTPITIQKPNKRRRSHEEDEDDDGSEISMMTVRVGMILMVNKLFHRLCFTLRSF